MVCCPACGYLNFGLNVTMPTCNYRRPKPFIVSENYWLIIFKRLAVIGFSSLIIGQLHSNYLSLI